MAARSTSQTQSTGDTNAARESIGAHLTTLDTLLRLLDPDTPFQPIFIGSIDLVAWQALFGEAAEAIEQQFPKVLHSLPKRAQAPLKAAGSQLFSLAHIAFDDVRVHTDPRAQEYDDLPELQGLVPELAPTEEAAELIRNALTKGEDFKKRHADKIARLERQLAASAVRLKQTLTGTNGVLTLLRRRIKKSKAASSSLQKLVDELDAALASIPTNDGALVPKARWRCSSLVCDLKNQVDPQIDAILKQAVRPHHASKTSSSTSSLSSRRQTIKNTYARARDAAMQDLAAVRTLEGEESAEIFRELFAGPVKALAAELARTAPELQGDSRRDASRCILDAISDLDGRVISGTLMTQWTEFLTTADDYSYQVVLAGLHHLAQPNEKGEAGVAFSEEALAQLLTSGEYKGVNPGRESSKTPDAEVRRVRRALQYLRRINAAVHGRLHWTPSPKRLSATASDRLWTINPLLACHPRIRRVLAAAPALVERDTRTRDSRPHPTKRNRGRRRKT